MVSRVRHGRGGGSACPIQARCARQQGAGGPCRREDVNRLCGVCGSLEPAGMAGRWAGDSLASAPCGPAAFAKGRLARCTGTKGAGVLPPAPLARFSLPYARVPEASESARLPPYAESRPSLRSQASTSAYRQTFQHSGLGAKTLQILSAVSEAASLMRAEGDDGFAPQRLGFEQGKERHGHGAPPVGIADENRIICFRMRNAGADFRSGIPPLFLPCLFHHGIIIRGVGRDGFKFDDVAADPAMDMFREAAGVAGT